MPISISSDWRGPAFLVLFLVLSAAAVVVILIMRRRLGGLAVPHALDRITFFDVALMTAGTERAADTVLLGFLAAGTATLQQSSPVLTIHADQSRLPQYLASFTFLAGRSGDRHALQSEIEAHSRAVWKQLVEFGLAVDPEAIKQFQRVAGSIVAALSMIGVAGLIACVLSAYSAHFLVVALAVIPVIAGIFLTNSRLLTHAGRAALKSVRTQNTRAIRAPRDHELVLAFALAGPGVLTGTVLEGFLVLFGPWELTRSKASKSGRRSP